MTIHHGGSTSLAAFIVSPPLPPIAVVFGSSGSRFIGGAGSNGNDSRWQCAAPDLSSASCMPFRLMVLMAIVTPMTTPLTSANQNLGGPPPPPLVPPRQWRFTEYSQRTSFEGASLSSLYAASLLPRLSRRLVIARIFSAIVIETHCPVFRFDVALEVMMAAREFGNLSN